MVVAADSCSLLRDTLLSDLSNPFPLLRRTNAHASAGQFAESLYRSIINRVPHLLDSNT